MIPITTDHLENCHRWNVSIVIYLADSQNNSVLENKDLNPYHVEIIFSTSEPVNIFSESIFLTQKMISQKKHT